MTHSKSYTFLSAKAGALAFAIGALAVGAAAAPGASAPAADGWRLERAVTLKSSNTSWDYNALDERRGYMFISHRHDGLQVYDGRRGRLVTTLRNSQDTNTAALAPEFDLGIAGTTDGDVILFRPSDLQTLSRNKSTTEGFDGSTYDSATKRFALVGEADETRHATPVLFFDGKTGRALGAVDLASEKVDAPRPDGSGHLFLPLRDRAAVARIDARSLAVDATWPLAGCASPASLDVDAEHRRVFVACRGNASSAPALTVIDADSGRQLARVPIGRGTDDVFYDKAHREIVTVDGEEAVLSVIRQVSADEYTLAQTVSTRPMARTGVFDAAAGRIHLVTAQFVKTPAAQGAFTTTFVPDTFTVLTYQRGAAAQASGK